ncbi:lysosomal alpha-mannosidase-like [Neocloeon triangulifer]|uniref:lysosomal alpha-mannosidase-like n=1 Tax=Neocloeon triangulifer TaxID=2078957 RepID=UPI00286F3E48|nr:lysosomal alpha-mannosidase-like [Neocloeon triangulifer]
MRWKNTSFVICVNLIGTLLAFPTNEPDGRAICGACHPIKENFTNVHLIPHTHDDVGWLKTVDQYFYGKDNDIQVAGVQYIIDSVVEELAKNPDRRFIYVETAFLKQWWDNQGEATRAKMRGLIETGQLELISGAWSMHDEAVTHYHSIIDQFTYGLRTIDEMFDGLSCAKPKIGWQIDPFGHARETASILAQMGFDGLFFARLDKDDRARRIKDREMEFVWKASPNLGESSDLFTHAFYKHYSAPDGFCFDLVHCTRDDPIITDTRSPDYNVPERVKAFMDFVDSRKDTYQTENMLVTMGDDFTYQQAASWFDNIDRLIKHVNAEQENGSKINLIYSTPSCYLQAVHAADKVWKSKSDDFFPYADGDHSYWTGYYTSRPTLKFMERKGNNLLQVCKQLSVLADLRQEKWQDLDSLQEAMGVMQHHDAITGTEKQHVAEDYALMLHKAMLDCLETSNTALNKLSAKSVEVPKVEYKSCLLSNVSQCELSENNVNFVVTLYNPLAQETSSYVRLPVQNFKHKVYFNGSEIPTQMIKIPTPVFSIPYRTSTAEQELLFVATIPPLGFRSFYITKTTEESPVPEPVADDQKFTLSNNKLELNFDPLTGLAASLNLKSENFNYPEFNQNFFYYKGSGGNILNGQTSGAYIFRPDGDDPTPISSQAEIETFKGEIVQETHQKFSDWVSQVVRVYTDAEYVEFEWQIGPIPADRNDPENPGKEVITKYSIPAMQTQELFHTDSNGRESIERKRNFRPTWELDLKEPVAGNYHPVTTFISTRDGRSEFGIVTDRAQGGTSMQDGTLELMLHRRLMYDDARGVGESLNETFDGNEGMIARGRHLMYLELLTSSPTPVAKKRRWSRDQMNLAPWTFVSGTELTEEEWMQNYAVNYKGIDLEVPENINILTLEPINKGEDILVRFEHFYEANDDPVLSLESFAPTQHLTERFGHEKVFMETTLGGNKWKSDTSRMKFKIEGDQEIATGDAEFNPVDNVEMYETNNVVMKPMQMRTFIVRNDSGSLAASVLVLLFSTFIANFIA